MRVFISIDFSEEVKSYLGNIITRLKNYCEKGNFTRADNLHLTLIFIGETDESNIPKISNSIKEAVSSLNSFTLAFNKLGNFKRGDSNLLWIGSNYSEDLIKLHQKLSISLKQSGTAFDEKKLTPHITLGRQIISSKDMDELLRIINTEKIVVPVDHITLMESKRIDDKLTYVPLDSFKLKTV